VCTRCVARPFAFEDAPTRGSRFTGWVSPITDEQSALACIAEAERRWSDASHHAWAYRLAAGAHRSHDAGEPGGSAGRPLLAQIDGHGVTDVVVVVARWFGGTKLGVGGLIRAYGGCAGRTLDRAEIVRVTPMVDVVIRHEYDDTGAIEAVIARRTLEIVETTWAEHVRLVLRVPASDAEEVRAELRDRTAGRAKIDPPPPRRRTEMPVERVIEHRAAHGRGAFEIHDEDEELLAELTYIRTDGWMTLPHTWVHRSLRGQGIARKLVQAAIDLARAEGLSARPVCSYVQRVFAAEPEAVADIVA